MSTYNGEEFLREQIESILKLKGDFSVDLWVRDDGSTDNTGIILDEYQMLGKLKWYSGNNLKPAKSFMELLFKCKGYDYYAFCDQDDWWNEQKIKKGIECLEAYDFVKEVPALYFSNAILVDKQLKDMGRKVYKKQPHIDLYTGMCAANALGCTMIFNSKLAEIVYNRMIPQIVGMHDAYMLRTCLAVGGKVIYDDNAYIKYRQHNSNVIGVKVGLYDKIKQRINTIISKQSPSIDKIAEEILCIYGDIMPHDCKEWITGIVLYNKNILNRFKLAFSRKTIYSTRNLVIRLSILLGNR